MVGLIFTITLLSILGAVGFLFAWMVRLASHSIQKEASEQKTELKNPAQDTSCTTKS